MAQLIVRNLDPELVRMLKVRAAERGLATEAYHRELLREAVLGGSQGSFKEALLAMPDFADDEDFVVDRGEERDVAISA